MLDGPRLSGVTPRRGLYPIPYSEAFHADLVAYRARQNDAAFGKHLSDKYTQTKVVVLVERESEPEETHEVAVLKNLTLSAMMKKIGMQHLPPRNGVEIKVAGLISIYVFDHATDAVGFAQAFRQALAEEGASCRIGIEAGPVLVFDLPTGGKDIAGAPVNVASKMAQDKGEWGKIYLSRAVKDLAEASGFVSRKLTVSGVEMTAYEG